MVGRARGERLLREDGLYSVEEDAVVTVDVFADGVDGDSSVCDAQVCEDGPGLDEWLLAALIWDSASVQQIPRFLCVRRELVVPRYHWRWDGGHGDDVGCV